MRVVSANVNGIRAAVRRGMLPWVDESAPDVMTLQEVRASRSQLDSALEQSALQGWSVALHEGEVAGRAGVAVLVRPGCGVGDAVTGLPMEGSIALQHAGDFSERMRLDDSGRAFASAGRWLEVPVLGQWGSGIEKVTVVSAYVHSGDVDRPEVMAEKYALMEAMSQRFQAALASGEHLLVTGDLNVAHREVDLKNWRGNLKKAGFLPEERAFFDRWMVDWGMVDLGRRYGGDGPGPYTWWSWRGKDFNNDAGWRIDYHLATPELAEVVKSVWVGRAETYEERWSDHAPVISDFC
ncbi:exodeoxyribonuclease III [Dermatophilus congolensis]|uniref:exodeoxyribonuclease III n=1 Tax=Dermatophilus congolensis TaxID=1863 RepID=UPI001AAFFDC8|nr:exodeoxyribonuclease III [Dermatophilus congolensis]MBO3141960.1 exodeoxyribonuclease III [Dermatophilus congolensis]MBO3150952.1 exodeoxyribonuclease III [Dermatophilus congolensis]MBO3162043.1 exodeoxyribonuclease III [Dermatophilus congolensis]MBO3162235.1 exodeoxyribonuclease III [Dermatophilus congolensis]MBO3175791.1 exodeoxyribonuclease III [Dermatophilus congolensis]